MTLEHASALRERAVSLLKGKIAGSGWQLALPFEMAVAGEAARLVNYLATRDGRASVSEQPMINFATHQARAGAAGAREDFEQMLGLLVRATEGERVLSFPTRVIGESMSWSVICAAG